MDEEQIHSAALNIVNVMYGAVDIVGLDYRGTKLSNSQKNQIKQCIEERTINESALKAVLVYCYNKLQIYNTEPTDDVTLELIQLTVSGFYYSSTVLKKFYKYSEDNIEELLRD